MTRLPAAAARERFAAARVATLATVAADGVPHVVPIAFAVEADTIYSAVDDKPKATTALRRLRNVEANPRVSVLVDHYEEGWAALWWARADGLARTLEPGCSGEARRGVEMLRARYPQQTVVGAVLAIDVRRWSGWAATG